MPKNYYVILGIPPTSSISDIKAAYRRLVKEFHPDRRGSNTKAPFLAIQEAYSVLSDPNKRRRYDRDIDTVRVQVAQSDRRRPSAPAYESEAEPLIPGQGFAEPLAEAAGGARGTMWPGPTLLFDHFFDLASEIRAGSEPPQPQAEIRLTKAQAAQGGHIRLSVPAEVRCPDCGGSGGGLYECWRCFGEGTLRGRIPLLLSYPAGLADNHRVEIPLARHGLAGGRLSLRFTIVD